MIYLKNNTEVQEIFIPRQTVLGSAYVETNRTYDDGYRDGIVYGKQIQKNKLTDLTITQNGEYTREDGYRTVTVDVPTEGGVCNLGEGEIFLTTNDIGTYEMYASDDDYDGWSKFIVTLEGGGAIKVYKASDLLDIFNNGENIDYGAYYYVGGEITEIEEINTEFGNATYILDNGFKIYRGDWFDGTTFTDENQIKVGAYIVVYGIIQDYRGQLQFKAHSQVIAYQENEGSEPTPPQDGWGMVGYFNSWGGTPDIPFEENGEWEGRPYKVIRGFEAVQGEFKIRLNNAWVNSYTANFYNEPQFAKLQKGDWNMPIDDGVWDIYLFFGDDGEPNEMLILFADTDLYSLQYEYTLNVYTNIQNTIILIDSFYSGMTDVYFGGSAIAVPMKYGNNYTIRTVMEGYEPISEQLTCYTNEDRYYTLTKIEGGDCNLGTLDLTLTDPYTVVKDASEDGYDGYNQVIVRPDNIIYQEKEFAINEFKNKMQEITITENGTYSIDDAELVNSIAFDGNSYFDTGIVPTENIKIEVCIKVTDGNDNGMGGIIIGGGIAPVDSSNYNGDENRGIAIGMGGGAIYGVWGTTRSYNDPYKYEGEGTTTVVLQKDGGSWGWEGEKGSFGASTLYIGGYNRNGEEVEEKFTQSIVYVKIWTDRNDDSTMTLFRPKNMAQGGFGLVNSEGTEYNYVENIGDGTTTYKEEWINIYPYGFKKVEVNVDGGSCNIQEYKWVRPSMADRAENGDIYIYPDEGFDAVGYIDFDPSDIYNAGYTDGSNQLSNNVLEGDMVLSFQLNDNNFPDLRNDGQGIFMWDGFQVPLYIKKPNGCGELYLSGNYDIDGLPSLHFKFFQDSDYAKIEKLTINLYHILPNIIVNVVNLKELHLTERVEIIDKNAFQNCVNLKTIYCYYDNPDIYMYAHKESFVGLPNNGTLYVKESQQPSWGWIEDLGWTIVNI